MGGETEEKGKKNMRKNWIKRKKGKGKIKEGKERGERWRKIERERGKKITD